MSGSLEARVARLERAQAREGLSKRARELAAEEPVLGPEESARLYHEAAHATAARLGRDCRVCVQVEYRDARAAAAAVLAGGDA